MPDDPSNSGPVDPVKQYGTPSEDFNQSGTGTPSIDPSVQKTLDALGQDSSVLLDNMQKLVSMLTQSKAPVEAMGKEFQKWSTNVKLAVSATEDVAEAAKEVLDMSKKFAKDGLLGLNKKSYSEVKQRLETLKKAQTDLLQKMDKGVRKNSEEFVKLSKSIKASDDAMAVLETSARNVKDGIDDIDPQVFEEIARVGHKAYLEMDKLGKAIGRGGKVSSGIQDLAKIMGSGMFEKFARAGAISKELGKWRAQTKLAGAQEFEQMKAARGGPGGFLEKFAGRAPEKGGGLRGWLGRQAGATLEAGGGKLGEGMGMRALSGAAGIGEGVMGAVGEAAVPLGILNGARKLYDMTIEQNKDINKAMGKGGLFTGGGAGSARDVLQAVKYNMAAQGMSVGGFGVSTLGVGTGKQNEEILAAFQDLGVAVPELTDKLKENAMTGVISDKRARGFGGVQGLAYTTGKQLGFTTGETSRENLKYLLQFGQSQESVNHLFERFVGDTKASGITTTKYLSIIDSITDRFDHMGKSLESVTGILGVMGSTGIGSADDLKEALNFMLGGQKNLEQTAFLLQQPGAVASLAAGQGALATRQAAAAQQSLGTIGIDDADLKTLGGVAAAISRVAQSSADATTKQNLNQQLENLNTTLKAKAALTGGGNVVDMAANLKNLHSESVDTMLNVNGMLKLLPMFGKTLEDIRQGNAGAALTEAAEKLGVSADGLKNMPETMLLIGNAVVKDLAKSTDEQIQAAAKANPAQFTDLYNRASQAGLVAGGETNAGKQATALQEVAKGPRAGDLATLASLDSQILRNVSTGLSAFTDLTTALSTKSAAAAKTPEEIATALMSSEDVLTQATDRLTNKLGDMLAWLTDHFGGGPSPMDQKIAAGKASPIEIAQDAADKTSDAMKTDFWANFFTGNFKAAGKEFWSLQTQGGVSPGVAATLNGTAQPISPAEQKQVSTYISQVNMNTETSQTVPVKQPTNGQASEHGSGLQAVK